MLREDISSSLKASIKAKDGRATSTLRLISAAIKDRDIAARDKGNQDGISNDDILGLLQSMIKQRQESIKLYLKGNRRELADQEQEEIEVIKGFLPIQLTDEEIAAAIEEAVSECDAGCIKDMGAVMGKLKKRYTGRMDFGKASGLVKKRLC